MFVARGIDTGCGGCGSGFWPLEFDEYVFREEPDPPERDEYPDGECLSVVGCAAPVEAVLACDGDCEEYDIADCPLDVVRAIEEAPLESSWDPGWDGDTRLDDDRLVYCPYDDGGEGLCDELVCRESCWEDEMGGSRGVALVPLGS